MGDLAHLIDHDIPEARQELEGSYTNLERVAAYCEASYLQSPDKAAALEATKRFTVQSLASVAFQINFLADNLLQMLNLQTEKMLEIEHQVHGLYQSVDVHKEKVARREIGVLTAGKNVLRQHKIVAPASPERQVRYSRRKIDYGLLDDIGHGVRQISRENPVRHIINRAGSTVSAGSSSSGGSALQYMQTQSDGSSQYGPGGRFASASRSTGKEYRTPVTIAPPTAPLNSTTAAHLQQRYPHLAYVGDQPQYSATVAAHQPQHQRASILSSGYATSSVAMRAGNGYAMQRVSQHMEMDESLPPPPTELMDDGHLQDSPPLPPPPPQFGLAAAGGDTVRQSGYAQETHYVPPNLMETVVAIYDYEASKPDELTFKADAVIYVTNKNEDGWFEGVLDGQIGLFPGNYVEPFQ